MFAGSDLRSGPRSARHEHTQDGKDSGNDGQPGGDQMDPHEHGAVLGAFEQVIKVGGRVAVATLLVEDAALGSGSFFPCRSSADQHLRRISRGTRGRMVEQSCVSSPPTSKEGGGALPMMQLSTRIPASPSMYVGRIDQLPL